MQRGFVLEVAGESRSGPVLVTMMNRDETVDNMDVIKYCLIRGKLKNLDDLSGSRTALAVAFLKGYVG